MPVKLIPPEKNSQDAAENLQPLVLICFYENQNFKAVRPITRSGRMLRHQGPPATDPNPATGVPAAFLFIRRRSRPEGLLFNKSQRVLTDTGPLRNHVLVGNRQAGLPLFCTDLPRLLLFYGFCFSLCLSARTARWFFDPSLLCFPPDDFPLAVPPCFRA